MDRGGLRIGMASSRLSLLDRDVLMPNLDECGDGHGRGDD